MQAIMPAAALLRVMASSAATSCAPDTPSKSRTTSSNDIGHRFNWKKPSALFFAVMPSESSFGIALKYVSQEASLRTSRNGSSTSGDGTFSLGSTMKSASSLAAAASSDGHHLGAAVRKSNSQAWQDQTLRRFFQPRRLKHAGHRSRRTSPVSRSHGMATTSQSFLMRAPSPSASSLAGATRRSSGINQPTGISRPKNLVRSLNIFQAPKESLARSNEPNAASSAMASGLVAIIETAWPGISRCRRSRVSVSIRPIGARRTATDAMASSSNCGTVLSHGVFGIIAI